MSTGAGARIYDVGYRPYEGARRSTWWAVWVVALHATQRVLGLRRSFRHKVLPGLALLLAFAPAIVSFLLAVVLENALGADELFSYGEYSYFTSSALALFAAFVAPEALCTDRRTGMLGLYLAGPLDRGRYLLAKAGAVLGVMLLMTLGPPLFLLAAYVVEGLGPAASEIPLLLARIVASGACVAALYASVGLGVASLTTRKSIAAIAFVLLVLVPQAVVEPAIESGGAPDVLALAGLLSLPPEVALRIFGEAPSADAAIGDVSSPLVLAGAVAWTLLGAAVTWLSYRRVEAHQ